MKKAHIIVDVLILLTLISILIFGLIVLSDFLPNMD